MQKKNCRKSSRNPLELGLKGRPNRERLTFLFSTSLPSGLVGKQGVQLVHAGSMCPKALGQAIMGGLRVPGAVSSENWRCGRIRRL